MKENLFIVCKNENIKNILIKEGYSCTTLKNYGSFTENENNKAIQWIKEWADKPILNSKSFKELFSVSGLSIFWFLENRFYFYRIRELIITIERMKVAIHRENPEKICIKGNLDTYHILKELSPEKIDKTEINEDVIDRTVESRDLSGFLFLKLILLKLFRGIFPILQYQNLEKNILILTEIGNWRQEKRNIQKKIFWKDIIFSEIISKLKILENKFVIIDYENKPENLLKSYKINKLRKKFLKVDVIPWEKFMTFNIILKARKQHKEFNKIFELIKNSDEYKNSFIYEGILLYKILDKDIERLLKTFKSFSGIAMIESSEKMIEVMNPSIILMHDEYGSLQLSIINAAKKKHIPTISIQHGIIYEGLLPYTHKKNHIYNKIIEKTIPMPDKLCVWSKNSKDVLLRDGNIPEKNISITGDSKLDYLETELQKFSKNEIMNHLDLPFDKKFILLVTENLPDFEETKVIFDTVIENIKNESKKFLIIKLHPLEKYSEFYNQSIKKYNIKNVKIISDIDLYKILIISDVVIVSYSTVGVEAMRLKKPVIAMNLLGKHDEASIIKQKMAFVINEKNELLPAIHDCMRLDSINEKLEKSKIFAQDELGIIDGKATDRIMREIVNLKSNFNKNN